MMSRVMGDMRAAGYDKVMLWVFANNIRARKFYESFGFSHMEKLNLVLKQKKFATRENYNEYCLIVITMKAKEA